MNPTSSASALSGLCGNADDLDGGSSNGAGECVCGGEGRHGVDSLSGGAAGMDVSLSSAAATGDTGRVRVALKAWRVVHSTATEVGGMAVAAERAVVAVAAGATVAASPPPPPV